MKAAASSATISNKVANLYYTRLRYDLTFYNVNKIVATHEDIMYEYPMAQYKDSAGNLISGYVPPFPTGSYEPGSRAFAGWYTTAECLPGTEVDFDEFTMPNGDITLYAKWEPVSYVVNYYMSYASLQNGETIPEEMARRVREAVANGATAPANDPYTEIYAEAIIKHGSLIGEVSEPGVSAGYETIHPYAAYDFVGWFYINDEGEETAFDPENMPVDQNLDLYAKWSSNVLRAYTVYFLLDADGNGEADTDANGNVIYVADPITGSSLAGNSRTFDAKGDTALYHAYQIGYYPHVQSHTLVLSVDDPDHQGANTFTFLYTPADPVPYTVKYINKATGTNVFDGKEVDDKVVSDNNKAVVTENFKVIAGYMPDAYQKMLVVTPGGANEIIFYYTKDETHAPYQINHYIQNLDGNSWTLYENSNLTGDINKLYSEAPMNIDGFTFSETVTNGFNVTQKKNGATGEALPGAVNAYANGVVSGTLTNTGMELNLYYTRDVYPYQIFFKERTTGKDLIAPINGTAPYGKLISHTAQSVIEESVTGVEFELYDTEPITKSMTITEDAIGTNHEVSTNKIIFWYTRCTQDLTVTKTVEGEGADRSKEFTFALAIDPAYNFHQDSYESEQGWLSHQNGVIRFTLKHGESITIKGLPTADYTITEENLPAGYYPDCDSTVDGEQAARTFLLAKADTATVVACRNVYDPASLTIGKTVQVVEEDNNVPEVESFEFTIAVPTGVSGTFKYTVGTTEKSATVENGKMVIALAKGEVAIFDNLPLGSYTVTEENYATYGYDSNYKLNGGAETAGREANVTLTRGADKSVEFVNKFPVGDMTINKTVTKQFYGTAWTGDTFTFTIERTNRTLLAGNTYKVTNTAGTVIGTAVVSEDGKLVVEVAFDATDAALMDEASEQGVRVTKTIIVNNLPAGTYTVTETEDADYVQSTRTVSGLAVPAEEITASFTNTVIRKSGSLYLEKELVAAPGYDPNKLPEGTKFGFTVQLLEEIPNATNVTMTYAPATYSDGTAAPTTATLTNGQMVIYVEANQSVTINGLPEGKYRITEATIPYYANDFAHKVNGNWVEQGTTTTAAGQLYTEIGVIGDGLAEVKCTNTYPVSRADLVIQKLVTKAYSRDTLPEESFTFTVVLEVDDTDITGYDYIIYSADGAVVKTARVTTVNRSFSITLNAGEYVVVEGLPVCGYTVTETDRTADYNASYEVYVKEYEIIEGQTHVAATSVDTTGDMNQSGDGITVSRTFSAGKTDTIVFTNEYKRHLGTLTITKKVSGVSNDDTFLFHIKGNEAANAYVDLDVTIVGNGSVVIHDLPIGTYTVTEDIAWSWRYTTNDATEDASVTLADLDPKVEFSNTYDDYHWLNGTDCEPNVFTAPAPTQESGKKEDENENEGS